MEETPARRMSDQFSETVPKRALFDSMQSTQHNRDGSYQHERGTLASIDRGVVRKLDDFDGFPPGSDRSGPRGSEPIREIQSVQLPSEDGKNSSHPVTPMYTPKQGKNGEQDNFFKFSRKVN